MSGRNRGRQHTNQDADEERKMWKDIKSQAAVVDEKVVRVLIEFVVMLWLQLAM